MKIAFKAFFATGAVALVLLGADSLAITLNMSYFNEGDPVPHDENPSWDPDGTVLKAHFQAAKAIWEYLLPGGGSYDFEFEWDDDIGSGTLGLTTPGLPDFIEINPLQLWFADPTPGDNNEFNTPTQRLYSQLSSSDQSTYFPGTAPPGALEVNYQATGIANGTIVNGVPVNTLSLSGQTFVNSGGATVSVDASNGNDLLSTIVHEIGHVLGIGGIEPGDYNIDPQHVGGLNNVLVLEGGGGHLGGGIVPPPNTNIVPGFLMCNSCGVPGLRRIATATDILVIAEDQGITVVQLARVGSIANGLWSNASNWIGGDVPDSTQDVYISHGGVVTLDAFAIVNNLLLSPGNSLAAGGSQIQALGTFTYGNAAVSVGAGGVIAANVLAGDPVFIASTAGSLVRFNSMTGTTSTSTSFNGSMAIGFDNIPGGLTPQTTTFNPSLANWNIGENLTVGDETFANLIVDNGTWTINGNMVAGKVLTASGGGWGGSVSVENNAVMTIGGNVVTEGPGAGVLVKGTATLNIAGNITIGKNGQFVYRDNRAASNRPYAVAGGQSVIIEGALLSGKGGTLSFEDTANAADATATLEGGSGEGAAGGLVVFRGDSSAGDAVSSASAMFHTKGGHFGPAFSGVMLGNGGQVRFEGTSGASTATFINEGCQDSVPFNWQYGGTGGRTIFANNSNAQQATIHNHGASTPIALLPLGGATLFYNSSTAGSANITNHADATFQNPGAEAKTVFYDSSDAGNATIENIGVAPGGSRPGQTEFRGNSSAALSNIHNRTHLTPGGLAGRTDFYNNATAADATIHTYEGYSDAGRIEFHGNSRAERARLIVENVPGIVGSTGNGGHVIFRDFSRANKAQITLKANACCNGVQFFDNASADDSQIITEDGSGNITFWNSSKAADPTTIDPTLISLGRGSVMTFYDQSQAEDANITLAHGAQIQFSMNSSAGSTTIVAAGSSIYPTNGATITFNTTSLVNNSTITLHGGTAPLATGATAAFINGSHAGNATITANGGSNGGGGSQITFNSNAKGDNARIIANTGSTVDFLDQQFYTGGTGTTLGSIEGAGKYVLRGSLLTVGSLNLSTAVSGQIVDNPPGFATGGRLNKVGTGTLTLAGTNTYTGLTTVSAGALNVTGSIAGGAVVNNGGTLGGNGSIGGNVTVNSGGVFAPGASPGIITIGSLTMNAGATLQMEIGGITSGTGYDRIQSAGLFALNGTLQVSLTNGFTPAAGQSFDLFNWGSSSSTFSTLALPALAGLAWNTSQIYTTGELSIDSAGILGDYNNNGIVDAADYVVWRKNEGTSNVLPNDPLGGMIGTPQYDQWRAHFGQTAGSGSSAVTYAVVPEPATIVMPVMGMFVICFRGRGLFVP